MVNDDHGRCSYCGGPPKPIDEQPCPSLHAATVVYECGTEIVHVISSDEFVVQKRCDELKKLQKDIKMRYVICERKENKPNEYLNDGSAEDRGPFWVSDILRATFYSSAIQAFYNREHCTSEAARDKRDIIVVQVDISETEMRCDIDMVQSSQ